MSTPTPIRTLIEQATPGRFVATGPLTQQWSDPKEQMLARKELQARLNPQTVLAVVEALEASRQKLNVNTDMPRYKAVERALALLNGTAPENKP